jgi:hypothetical protein
MRKSLCAAAFFLALPHAQAVATAPITTCGMTPASSDATCVALVNNQGFTVTMAEFLVQTLAGISSASATDAASISLVSTNEQADAANITTLQSQIATLQSQVAALQAQIAALQSTTPPTGTSTCLTASGSTVPPATCLKDPSGNTWSLGGLNPTNANGGDSILVNGTALPGTTAGLLLLLYNGNIYTQSQSSAGPWYEWTGTAFTNVAGDPRL